MYGIYEFIINDTDIYLLTDFTQFACYIVVL